jgi:hypothetical protein
VTGAAEGVAPSPGVGLVPGWSVGCTGSGELPLGVPTDVGWFDVPPSVGVGAGLGVGVALVQAIASAARSGNSARRVFL